MDEKIDAIRQYVKSVLLQPGSHGLDHVLRVIYLCENIGKEENTGQNIVLSYQIGASVGFRLGGRRFQDRRASRSA